MSNNVVWTLELWILSLRHCTQLKNLHDTIRYMLLWKIIFGYYLWSVSEFNEFQLSAGLNLEKLNTIFSGTNHVWAAA